MPDATARFFDAMAASYDELEPWYRHLYGRLHHILRAAVPQAPPGARALDAGCGTGFQTAILHELGYRASGVDISGQSLAVARVRLPGAALVQSDLQALPFEDAAFEVVVCAGSTLDFLDDPERGIREIARVLRPRGVLLLEYERRWSLDLAWTLASSAMGDPLAYGLTAREAWDLVRAPRHAGVRLRYPGYPPFWLFSDGGVRAMCRRAGLRVARRWGIHAVTNLLPSTVLHRPRLSRAWSAAYGALGAIDAIAARFGPVRALAAHAVVQARRCDG